MRMGAVADVERMAVLGLGWCGRMGWSGVPGGVAVEWSSLGCSSIRIMDIRDLRLEPEKGKREEEDQRQSSARGGPAAHRHG